MKSLNPSPGADTTAWRIEHDTAAGVWVDHFDGRWLVQTQGNRFPDALKRLAEGVATSIYWRPRDKAASTAPEHVWGEKVTERFSVKENGANFWIDFDSGYSSGIFLDQRLNRRRVGESAKSGQRILNAFAYTGGFSVMATSISESRAIPLTGSEPLPDKVGRFMASCSTLQLSLETAKKPSGRMPITQILPLWLLPSSSRGAGFSSAPILTGWESGRLKKMFSPVSGSGGVT